jgi:hypothetical protein
MPKNSINNEYSDTPIRPNQLQYRSIRAGTGIAFQYDDNLNTLKINRLSEVNQRKTVYVHLQNASRMTFKTADFDLGYQNLSHSGAEWHIEGGPEMIKTTPLLMDCIAGVESEFTLVDVPQGEYKVVLRGVEYQYNHQKGYYDFYDIEYPFTIDASTTEVRFDNLQLKFDYNSRYTDENLQRDWDIFMGNINPGPTNTFNFSYTTSSNTLRVNAGSLCNDNFLYGTGTNSSPYSSVYKSLNADNSGQPIVYNNTFNQATTLNFCSIVDSETSNFGAVIVDSGYRCVRKANLSTGPNFNILSYNKTNLNGLLENNNVIYKDIISSYYGIYKQSYSTTNNGNTSYRALLSKDKGHGLSTPALSVIVGKNLLFQLDAAFTLSNGTYNKGYLIHTDTEVIDMVTLDYSEEEFKDATTNRNNGRRMCVVGIHFNELGQRCLTMATMEENGLEKAGKILFSDINLETFKVKVILESTMFASNITQINKPVYKLLPGGLVLITSQSSRAIKTLICDFRICNYRTGQILTSGAISNFFEGNVDANLNNRTKPILMSNGIYLSVSNRNTYTRYIPMNTVFPNYQRRHCELTSNTGTCQGYWMSDND